jgi:hypothetical protein
MSLSRQVFNLGETCLIWKHMVSHSFSSIKVKTEAVKDHCLLFLGSSVSKDLKLRSVMTQKIHRY